MKTEYGLLFKKTSTCKAADIEYLDENSLLKSQYDSIRQKISLSQAEAERSKLINSIEYLDKVDAGKVYAVGFLRERLLSSGDTAPETWGNDIRKKKIRTAIEKHVRNYGSYRGSIAHKLIFSMSGEFKDLLVSKGLNPDKILVNRMKKVLSEFQKEFYPGEKLGYAYGIHHDTNHPHIHVFLCNRTDSGSHIALSCPLKGKRDIKPRKNQIEFIQKELARQERLIRKSIEKNEFQKLEMNENTVKTGKIKAPSFSTGKVTCLMEAKKLQLQYQQLIKLHESLSERKYHLPNRTLYKLRAPKILRDFNTIIASRNIRKHRNLRMKYFALKKQYLIGLDRYYFRKSIENSPQAIRNKYFETVRAYKDKKTMGLDTSNEMAYFDILRKAQCSYYPIGGQCDIGQRQVHKI
ncbi:MAG: hypothetical protein A2X48_12865 [Lentisphaerae bacterium GWF2_49_21]|nr:MAG: hypothetical protein A2X48_12865 [Lentisphaerae bacterium GWF2_49_21]